MSIQTSNKQHAEKVITGKNEKTVPDNGISSWFKQHKQASNNAYKRLTGTPLSSLLTIFVVAIALSMPAALQIAIKNLEAGQSTVDKQASISLYLKSDTDLAAVEALKQQLENDETLQEVTYISSEQALQDFQQSSNLGNTLNSLKNNPLPASFIITPDTKKLKIDDIELLVEDYRALDAVELAQIDVNWLKKLFSIVDLLKHFAIGVSLFLIFAVFVLIGNTIRNLGQLFQEEIAISKLVGATDGFVRRIFLYSGLYYGLFGSLIALLFVFIGILWLTPHMNELISLYNANFSIIGLSIIDTLSIVGTGLILGLGGAWAASNRIINRLSL